MPIRKDDEVLVTRGNFKTREGKAWQPQQVKRLIQGYQQTYRRVNREMETATKAFIQAIA